MTLCICLGVSGCGEQEEEGPKRYQATFLELFDTVTTVIGFADTEEEFQITVNSFKEQLREYHELFDIYHEYEGITNLKTINDQAGQGPVPVEERLIDFLFFCKDMYEKTDGKVNAAMGSVLELWHDARNYGIENPDQAAVPDEEALQEAAKHMDFDQVVIDKENGTVEILDPELRLDAGALGKGYATEQVCKQMPEGMLISVGGNVRGTGAKPTDGSLWTVGIQDPDGLQNEYLGKVQIADLSVVSSGDYQRYYTVNGVKYHHIIDADTLYPAILWRGVTVLCKDSGIADGLSTALFLMNEEAGKLLLEQYDACAVWIDMEGNMIYSEGFSDYMKD